MLAQSPPIIPPAPKVHAKDLPTWHHLLTAQRNSLAIFPDYAFDVPFRRRTLLGIDAVLVNDPAGVRHVLATNAANHVRPTMMPRVLRPLLGRGVFLAEGPEWRQQRRLLSPVFTPHNVGLLLPHFTAAANKVVAARDRMTPTRRHCGPASHLHPAVLGHKDRCGVILFLSLGALAREGA